MTVTEVPAAAATARRRARRSGPRLAALAAGALGILLFPAPGLGWLAWVAFVPLLLVLRAAESPREAFIRGWCGGFGFLGATIYWLLPNLVYFFPLAIGAVSLLSAPWGCLVRAALRPAPTGGRIVLAVVAVPAGWVLVETARSWKPFGGPWSLLAASQWNHPAELGLASVGGSWLVSFAIMAANTALAIAAPIVVASVAETGGRRSGAERAIRRGAAVTVAAMVVTAAVAVAAGPLWLAAHPMPSPAPASGTVRVALVQPGVIQDEAKRLDAQAAITQQLAGKGVQLVVWGESSTDYAASQPATVSRLAALSASLGVPIMINGRSVASAGLEHNTSYLVDGTGLAAQYSKTRLVLFGEYIPFRGALGWLDQITKAAGLNLAPGDGPTLFTARIPDAAGGTTDSTGSASTLRVGPLICFESAFPDMGRTEARLGAQILVYQSADSTFQGSWEPAQHASLAALRAAETGRPAVQTALTGTSSAFDAQGRELAWITKDQTGSVVVSIPLSSLNTPFDRWGDYVPVLCAIVVFGWAALAGFGFLRRRRAAASDQ